MLDYKDIIQNTTLWVSVVIIRESLRLRELPMGRIQNRMRPIAFHSELDNFLVDCKIKLDT